MPAVFPFSSTVLSGALAALICVCAGAAGAQDKNYPSLMTKAIRDGDLAAVEGLLAEGADPEEGLFGFAPIYTASVEGHAEIAQVLIDAGADPFQFKGVVSAIHMAVNGDHVDVVKVLLDAGVPMDFATKERWEPPLLMQAARSNALDTINYLLDRGADIDMRDKCQDPAIAAAAYWNNREAAELLIARGADLTTRSVAGVVCSEGATAVSYALRQGHTEMAEFLRQAGAVE